MRVHPFVVPVVIFVFSLLLMCLLLSSLDHLSVYDDHTQSHLTLTAIGLPTDLKSAKLITKLIKDSVKSDNSNDYYLILLLFSLIYLVKQTFSIPGSGVLNLLAGAVFSERFSLYSSIGLVCFLNTLGASCCYFLSYLLGSDLILKFINPGRLNQFKQRVAAERSQGNLFIYCLFSRLFPFTPNWFLNLASPVVGIDFLTFSSSIAIGLLPYNIITVQTGAVLNSVQTWEDVISLQTSFKLCALAGSALIPVILKKFFSTQSKEQRAPSSLNSLDSSQYDFAEEDYSPNIIENSSSSSSSSSRRGANDRTNVGRTRSGTRVKSISLAGTKQPSDELFIAPAPFLSTNKSRHSVTSAESISPISAGSASSNSARRRRKEVDDLERSYLNVYDKTPIKFLDGQDHTQPQQLQPKPNAPNLNLNYVQDLYSPR
jgi:uncharacterized membrane protein YdjX (TVP38/TMEM64 family)